MKFNKLPVYLKSLFKKKEQSEAVADYNDKVSYLERYAKKQKQEDVPVTHYHANGLYAREVVMAAGLIVTGKVHADEHICIISRGHVRVATPDGMVDIHAPFTMVSPKNTKRVLHIITETIWTTFHANPTNTGDVKQLEKILIKQEANTCLG